MAGVGAGSGQAPLTLHSGVQPARRGPLGQAARRSASVSSRIRVRAISGMAAVPARRASGASGARTVSTGLGGGGGPQGRRTGQGRAGRSHGRGTGPRGEGQAPGPLEPCRCLSPLPLQSASGASLGQGAGRRAPAPRAWPATLSAASVGSSVPLATTGRTAAKVSGPSAQVGCRVSGRAGRQAPEVLELGTASALKPGSGSTLTAVSPPWSCSGWTTVPEPVRSCLGADRPWADPAGLGDPSLPPRGQADGRSPGMDAQHGHRPRCQPSPLAVSSFLLPPPCHGQMGQERAGHQHLGQQGLLGGLCGCTPGSQLCACLG